jgi:hypothetical protein
MRPADGTGNRDRIAAGSARKYRNLRKKIPDLRRWQRIIAQTVWY